MTLEHTLHWTALAIAVGANILANVSFKVAMTNYDANASGGNFFYLLQSWPLWIGILAASVLLGAYLFAIRALPIGVAYVSVTSLAMVGLVVSEKIFFGNPLGISKMVGLLLVVAGISMIYRAA